MCIFWIVLEAGSSCLCSTPQRSSVLDENVPSSLSNVGSGVAGSPSKMEGKIVQCH